MTSCASSRRGPDRPHGSRPSGPLLALANAESELLVAVLDDEEVRSSARHDTSKKGGRGGSVAITAPAVAHVLASAGLAAADIRGVACVTGPGGFTGVRVAASFAEGFAAAHGLPLAALSHMQLVATHARSLLPEPTPFWVVTHARRELVHVQSFDANAAPTDDVAVLHTADATEQLRGHAACGSGLVRNCGLNAVVQRLDTACDSPSPEALAALARCGNFCHEPLAMHYVRDCDAVEDVARFAALRGIDESEARAILQR